MADTEDIERIKRLTNGATDYTDEQIGGMLDAGLTIREIAHDYWTEQATKFASLVDVSESGSSRSMSQLHKNALTLAARFAPLEEQSGQQAFKMTRPAVRG